MNVPIFQSMVQTIGLTGPDSDNLEGNPTVVQSCINGGAKYFEQDHGNLISECDGGVLGGVHVEFNKTTVEFQPQLDINISS